jgi:CPA2 family monovalent cation:H+ antiporter-2
LGTDEQIEAFRYPVEQPPGLENRYRETQNYELRRVAIAPASKLVEQTIRQAGLRDRFAAMVVGIERAGKRNINPSSDLAFHSGDVLWVVGEAEALDRLQSFVEKSNSDDAAPNQH